MINLFCQKRLAGIFYFLLFSSTILAQPSLRKDILLNNNWQTTADDSNQHRYDGFEKSITAKSWRTVNLPHNWDGYEGYRRLLHGNKHGYAWYKKTFAATKQMGKKYFLWFEGVGSFATVWLNGKQVGYHAGGRTSFTIDVSDVILFNQQNLLAVRADHPAFIKNLPWVCGGCSDERGFSEGSQPMGIFRPVHLVVTSDAMIEPFGVHAWNDTTVSINAAIISIIATIKNYTTTPKQLEIINTLLDNNGNAVQSFSVKQYLADFATQEVPGEFYLTGNVKLWTLKDPYLYQIKTAIKENGRTIDEVVTPYGVRSISWPVGKAPSSNQFYLNGQPVFINGIAEYEHLLGASHAFSDEQVSSRAGMVKAAGFNAFRDGHQPHNLRYQHYWDSLGILSWTQLSAHVWYDTKEFRDNFKMLLKEWVIERRNSPSVVLWGLQNESKLPADFAKECTELIRSLDPTASSQRLVTTCNGGDGTDWDVPQNWTGTYAGDPKTYASDIKKQILIGEYGAWRTIDLHTEGGFTQNGILSEDRMTQLMEMKIQLAESVKDSCAGQFFWLLTSHDNPGRVQGGEGFRELDRIGPVNYKGLLTPWEEPTDAFYMFRSNYADKQKDPMVYIVSHTWPDRWTQPGIKDSIIVYSNCDEVELFNDVNKISLGKRKRNGIGTHFLWDKVNIQYNVLYAVGYVDGKIVAKDTIILHHLPVAPNFGELYKDNKNLTKGLKGYHYIYRVNCGGPAYTDENKNEWLADQAFYQQKNSADQNWGSTSWTSNFNGMPAAFASQRQTYSPVGGTRDWKLFQSFRYGRDQLKFLFSLPDGDYKIELYFSEPWLGIAGRMNCSGMRLFDIAVNNKTVIKNLDIWKEAGCNTALKKTVSVKVTGGQLVISFPDVAAGQAIISAIAIASLKNLPVAKSAPGLIADLKVNYSDNGQTKIQTWLNTGDQQYADSTISFVSLPPVLFGAEWIRFPRAVNNTKEVLASFNTTNPADIFIGIDSSYRKPDWMNGFENTGTFIRNSELTSSVLSVYRKRFAANESVELKSAGKLSEMYPVMALPVTSMQPAYDLKPISSYKVAAAKYNSAVSKTTVNEKDALGFTATNGSVEWNIQTGVADIYSFTFRYANTTNKNLYANLVFSLANGTIAKTERLEFTPSKPGKWNYVSTNTGNMINAGAYVVKLVTEDAVGLSLTGVDIQ